MDNALHKTAQRIFQIKEHRREAFRNRKTNSEQNLNSDEAPDISSRKIFDGREASADYLLENYRNVSKVEQYQQSFLMNDVFYVENDTSAAFHRSNVVGCGDGAEVIAPESGGRVVQGDYGQCYIIIGDDAARNFEIINAANYDVDEAVFLDENEKQQQSSYLMDISKSGECANTKPNIPHSRSVDDDDRYDMVGEMRDEVVADAPAVVRSPSRQETLPYQKRRVEGYCHCPHCGQSFINMTRLERHLTVHQLEARLDMDIDMLKQVVDNLSIRKRYNPSDEIGISRKFLYDDAQSRSELTNVRRNNACPDCGTVFLTTHLGQHAAVHGGHAKPDIKSASGEYYCDLCGLMFRRHFNLLNHWRTYCFVILDSLPEGEGQSMSDDELIALVVNMMRKVPNGPRSANFLGTSKLPAVLASVAIDAAGDTANRNTEKDNYVSHKSGANTSTDNRWTDDSLVGNEEATNVDEVENLTDAEQAAGGDLNWPSNTDPVQCKECFRSFANASRLEKHVAGFHSSVGPHNCVLCGSRFKYDYNLLHHYRRSCQYTKVHLDQDLREMVDATTLRKTVRMLSKSEGLRLNSSIGPIIPRSIFERGVINDRKQPSRFSTSLHRPLPQLLLPRPGLSNGRQCPLCSVFFYGVSSLERHLKNVHASDDEFNYRNKEFYYYEARKPAKVMGHTDIDGPPELMPEEPVVEPAQKMRRIKSNTSREIITKNDPHRAYIRGAHHFFNDDRGNRRFINCKETMMEGKIKEEIDGIETSDLGGLWNCQQFIAGSELNMQHGDQFFIVHNEMDDYDSVIGEEDNNVEFMTSELGSFVTLNQRCKIEGVDRRKQVLIGDEPELFVNPNTSQELKSLVGPGNVLEEKSSCASRYYDTAGNNGNQQIKCTRLIKVSLPRKGNQ